MSQPLKTFSKDPQAALTYTVDWEPWLNGDTIATSTFTPASGITKDSQSNTTLTATVKLSAGTVGEDYDVVNRITTTAGLTDERTIRILVRQQ